jgi:DNA-directed RNA polymerase subunit H (RpoH/RPB5)
MEVSELQPIEKSNKQQIDNVKTNLITMLSNRGFINKENIKSYAKKLIDMDDDNDMKFEIKIDNDTNYNTTIKNKLIFVKFFDYKIMSVSKNSEIGNFVTKYFDEYKIIIVDNINPKTEIAINAYDTQVEIFKINFLKQNIIDHVFVPQHIVLTKEEGDEVTNSYNVLNKNFPFILSCDPQAKYYNMKVGDICKIIRSSKVSGEAFIYRKCIPGN